ncbi:hypothetical protein ILUMI_08217 [Ignelater luminosus]|uniref:PPIase cyclophilin-type domain-containing protein n=1 Tax=Ignelater luminosus TaxID=2038154 RepID=A0A8K0D217_IGNLU|nr:hypothetical protein ILUMI_08217 [Ignelater luminosus]
MLMFEPIPEPPKIQFRIVGNVASPEFQICRYYIERLHKSFPKDYQEPDIRPLLDVDWNLFLIKLRRRIGGEKTWTLQRMVAVFMNGEFLGDDTNLLKFVATKYNFFILKDFEKIGKQSLIEHLTKQSELGRHFVYLTIAIDEVIIGSMLFLLYSDLVPLISGIFMKRCVRKRKCYSGTTIHRIVVPSWIQCGGWELENKTVPCENYVVPHDRRGVLSMCHNGKHTDNSTQFLISLDSTPWMDYKYVAFGQLLQGEEVLKAIEKVPTQYEAPTKKIQIIKCGEFTFYPIPDPKDMKKLEKFLATKDALTHLHEDVIDPRDTDSVMLRRRYKRGLYSHIADLKSYLPFLHLPQYLLYKYFIQGKWNEDAEGEFCFEDIDRNIMTEITELSSALESILSSSGK